MSVPPPNHHHYHTYASRFRIRDCLLQGTVHAAHAFKRKRSRSSQRFTPAFIYLHRSPAAHPFILLPFHPSTPPSLFQHPSIRLQSSRLCFFSPSLSGVTLIPRLPCHRLLLLNILGSVSVAVCRVGGGGRSWTLCSVALQLLLTSRLANRRAAAHTYANATCTHAELRAHVHVTPQTGAFTCPGLCLHMRLMQMSGLCVADGEVVGVTVMFTPPHHHLHPSWLQTSDVNE